MTLGQRALRRLLTGLVLAWSAGIIGAALVPHSTGTMNLITR